MERRKALEKVSRALYDGMEESRQYLEQTVLRVLASTTDPDEAHSNQVLTKNDDIKATQMILDLVKLSPS
jgi:hypothetical protein